MIWQVCVAIIVIRTTIKDAPNLKSGNLINQINVNKKVKKNRI
jgi:hypothetical protein